MILGRSQLKSAVVALAAVGLATVWLLEHRAQERLGEQNWALRRQVEQLARGNGQRQSPSAAVSAPGSKSALPEEAFRELLRLRGELGVLRRQKEELDSLRADHRRLRSNWAEQLLSEKRLSLPQVAAYLEAKQRSAESLLAAFRATGDQRLLEEAMKKYPDAPQVTLVAYCDLRRESSLAEHLQRLEAFKQSAPENALANYLSAHAYFKADQPDLAVHELTAAAGKPVFQDYASEFGQSLAEAYQAAGLSILEAEKAAAYGPASPHASPHLAGLRRLRQGLGELVKLYQQAGDQAGLQTVVQLGTAVSQHLGEPFGGKSLFYDALGLEIERTVLGAMDPSRAYDRAGHTVNDRLAELGRQLQTLEAHERSRYGLVEALSEQDQIGFFSRMRSAGELEALRWADKRQPQP